LAKAHEAIKKTVVFTINGVQIETVEEFKYLGQIVTREDNDEAAVKWNIARAKKKWASMRQFLTTDGVDLKSMAIFYRMVVMYVLLYGSETWVLADKRYDMAASHFSQEVLSRNNRRIYSSGGRWRMGLPRQQ
jgi:hypothetical protein